jgi:tetratricopeptide (TPR) repeat protein
MLSLGMVLAVAACLPPGQPQPERDAMVGHDDRAPACITAALQARYQSCPERRPRDPAAICTPRAEPLEEPAPRAELALDDTLRVDDPQLTAAEEAAAKAEASRTPADFRRARLRFRGAVVRMRGRAAEGWASYRFAHLLHAEGDLVAARARLADAIVFAMRRAAVRADRELAGAARSDFVRLYARGGDVHRADANFARLSPYEKTAPMLAELAAHLAAAGRTADLTVVMTQLALRDPDHRCTHRARVLDLARAKGERRVVVHALNELLAAYDALDLHEGDRGSCGVAAASHLIELAEQWRLETLDDASENAEAKLDLAEQLYRRVLATFTAEQLARWGLCVDLAELARRRGELLFRQRRWRTCGQSYDDALVMSPDASWAPEAAYAAVVCRQNAWAQTNRDRGALSDDERMAGALEHTEDWQRMLASFHRFLCVGGAEPAGRATTALARAEGFFDGGALWEAAVGFRVVAVGPATTTSERAMRRYAEVAEPLAADDTCRIELRADLTRLLRSRCTAPHSPDCRATQDVWQRLKPEQL